MSAKLHFSDSHCHLDFKEFNGLTEPLFEQCHTANINNIIVPAIAPSNWEEVLTLCNKKQKHQVRLHGCLGIHPWFLHDLSEQALEELTQICHLHKKQIVAIGETGIDGKIALEQDNLYKQIHFFEHQITLAKQLNLPLIIHHRRSHQEIVKILRQQLNNLNGGIIHAFSGSYQQAKQYIDLGFKLGIGGTITYPRAKKTINAIKRLPVTSMVLETDAPAMPLYGFQGQNNSPLRIIDIFNTLMEIRQESPEQLSIALEQNLQQAIPQIR